MVKELVFASVQDGRYNTSTFESHFATVRGHSRLYSNSLYMYILMYFRLIQEIVDLSSVSSFQKKLTELAKKRTEQGHQNWRCSYKDCKEVVDYFYI